MAKTFTAISVLTGSVIGAGVLGIPYVVMKSGFALGMLVLLITTLITAYIVLSLGEVSLRTKKDHQLSGYAAKYLGKKGKLLMLLTFLFGIYSALIAYLIGEGESLSIIFFNTNAYSLHFGIAFWVLLSAITYFGLDALKQGEKFGMSLIAVLITSIVIFFWDKIDVSNLTYNNPSMFYIPFGVMMFALIGFSAIPEVGRVLKKEKKLMKKTIIWSYVLIFASYVIFTFIVLGTQGTNTPQIATLSLGKIFIILGMLTMFTSYLALSIAFMHMLKYDYKKTKTKAWLYTILGPLIIFIILTIFKIGSFTKVLGIGGVIAGGLTGILIFFMAKNAKKLGDRKPEYTIPYSNILTWIIIIILVIGTVLEIVSSF
jgi:tyrosine-specific transport protein